MELLDFWNLQEAFGSTKWETIRLARKRKSKTKALKYKKNGCTICGSMKDLEGHHLYRVCSIQEKKVSTR